MSETSRKRSEDFLRVADQFKLGVLVTESSHPVTAELSQTAKRSTSDALRLLFEVDNDVVRKYREWSASDSPRRIADTLRDAIQAGGKVFFTGCGSTGRLSIQLASIWRDFWQKQRAQHYADDLENRAFSVMAGGDFALIKSVEGFEDFTQFGAKQIGDLGVGEGDVVFAITEGGETSFVIGTAWEGLKRGAKVYFVYNNPDDVLREHVQRSREVIEEPRIEKINLTTGPMSITGSTRMQATTIQLCVMLTVLEMVMRDLVAAGLCPGQDCAEAGLCPGQGCVEAGLSPGLVRDGDRTLRAATSPLRSDDVPAQFMAKLQEMHSTLLSEQLRDDLAKLVEMEERVYRADHRNNYFANAIGVDVLTDTTERSPTFCTPPFRKFDDDTAAESWAFLYLPDEKSEDAWNWILKKQPCCVEWDEHEVRALVGDDKFESTNQVVDRISQEELMRFRIGADGIANRPLGPGDSAVGILIEAEADSLTSPDGFYRAQLEAARDAGASTGVIYFGSESGVARMREFIKGWSPDTISLLVTVPETDFLLGGVTRAGAKMLLNSLSTCTMVRLGRVLGNVMIWLVASNLKLIDRSTRYIRELTGLGYEEANALLFEVVEYVEPRMKADQKYPPIVGLSVMRANYNLGNEDAEKKLMEEIG